MTASNSLFDLSGRTALITGGSRGLGLQMAKALGAEGAKLLLVARKAKELEAAVASLQAQGIDADWVAADMSRDEDIENLVEEALQRLGHIDILINNAGTTWGAPAEDYPMEAWDKVFNLNMRGQFLLTQQIGKRAMILQGYGRVLNIASISGLQGVMPDVMTAIAYTSSKGALINFTRSLAAEWGRYGITVNALAPGFFPTKLTNAVIESGGDAKMIDGVPLHRLGGDDDLMGPALLFASDASQHITGQVLAVDGGASIV